MTLSTGTVLGFRPLTNGATEVVVVSRTDGQSTDTMTNAEWDEYCALVVAANKTLAAKNAAKRLAASKAAKQRLTDSM